MNREVLCKVLLNDVIAKLEEKNSDTLVVQKKLSLIENIAESLQIGEKFKSEPAKLLYSLSSKGLTDLNKAEKTAALLKPLIVEQAENLENKNIILKVFGNYIDNYMPQDSDNLMQDKILETLPLVLEKARADSLAVNVFYDIPKQETLSFNKTEIADKFYSIPYGVCIAYLGQLKTPIFSERHQKSIPDETRRLDAMSMALTKLPPAKFMLFGLHFDKYVENMTKINARFVKACEKNVVPVIQDGSNKYLNSLGNMFGTDFVDYGSSGFIFKCLTTKFTPYNITRLCRIAEQIPSIDDTRFEQIRMDAIYINEVFESLRSYVHNQGKDAHRLLKRMNFYYQSSKDLKPETFSYHQKRKLKLLEVLAEINGSGSGYKFNEAEYLNLQNYNREVRTDKKTEKVHSVINRLFENTTPRTLETPSVQNPEIKAYFNKINYYDAYPSGSHEVFGNYLGCLNNIILASIDEQKYGIDHNLINTILWTERKAFNILEDMDAGYQLGAYKEDWFKNVIMFYELTNSSSAGKFDTKEFNDFFGSIRNMNMEDAYHTLSERTAVDIIDLSKKQRNGANKYLSYLNTLNLPQTEHERIKHKMQTITKLKIDSNMSGYRLSKAIFNMSMPRRCPYIALQNYMRTRNYNHPGD